MKGIDRAFSNGSIWTMNNPVRPTQNRPFYLPLVTLIGLTLIGGMFLVYLVLMTDLLGRFSVAAFFKQEIRSGGIRAALLQSEDTYRHFEKKQGSYDPIYRIWEKILKEAGVRYAIVRPADLKDRLQRGVDVLILPGVAVLSEKERETIETFVHGGGGVILSWVNGLYDEHGEWTGWSFVERLSGAKILPHRSGGGKERLLTVLNEKTPLNTGLPLGYKIEVFDYDEVFTAEKSRVDSLWLSEPPTDTSGSIVRGSYGKGRAVWFGFSPNLVSQVPEQQAYFRTVLSNALQWAGREPILFPARWPGGKALAFSLSVDVEDGMENLQRLFPLIERSRLPVTFFVLAEEAERKPELYQALRVGEMAIHGDVHVPFEGQMRDRQRARLQRAKRSVEGVSGRTAVGFRPIEERYDPDTLKAMGETGLKYMVVQPGEQSTPKAVSTEDGKKIYLLPRSSYDDFYLFYKSKIGGEEAFRMLQQDLKLSRFSGGLFIVPIHTTPTWGFLHSDEHYRVLERFLGWAEQQEGLWPTTLQGAVDWWEKRERVISRWKKRSDRRLDLSITNPSDKVVEFFHLIVYPPHNGDRVAVHAETRYRFRFDQSFPYIHVVEVSNGAPASSRSGETVLLKFGDLKPKETRTYLIDFLPR